MNSAQWEKVVHHFFCGRFSESRANRQFCETGHLRACGTAPLLSVAAGLYNRRAMRRSLLLSSIALLLPGAEVELVGALAE